MKYKMKMSYAKHKESLHYADITNEIIYDFERQHNGSIVIYKNEKPFDKLHVNVEKVHLKEFIQDFVQALNAELVYIGRNL